MKSILIIHDSRTGASISYRSDSIPKQHKWAYDHIVEQECGCLSVGSTVYEVKNEKDDNRSGNDQP